MAGALEAVGQRLQRLRRELRDLAEMRLALERLGLYDRVWEVEREIGRVRLELEKLERMKPRARG